jgi:hypothetical protein
MISTNGPTHSSARWRWPLAYRTSVAEPPRYPRLLILRSSCGHALGVGYVWRKQGYITVRTCR